MKKINFRIFLAFHLTVSVAVVVAHAIDAYDAPAPPRGLYFVNYPLFFMADKLKNGQGRDASDDLGLRYYANLFRLSYFNRATFKNTWVASILLPVGRIEVLDDHDQGLGDLTLVLGYWIIDKPGEKTWLSIAQFIDLPTGSFDQNKSANMGSNVWKIRPSLYFGKHLFEMIDLEFAIKYNFSTENHETTVKNGNELIVEGLLGYFIQPSVLVGVHFDANFGEDNTLNGEHILHSGPQGYRTGFSLDWVLDTKGINFKYLVDFGRKNAPEGHLFQMRFSWKFQ
jgi:hypothetical protein